MKKTTISISKDTYDILIKEKDKRKSKTIDNTLKEILNEYKKLKRYLLIKELEKLVDWDKVEIEYKEFRKNFSLR